MILIRADANHDIATGHLMRTLTIAAECVKRSMPVCFILADRESERIFIELCPDRDAYETIVLETDYRCPEAELPVLLPILAERLAKEHSGVLLIDSYYVTEYYLEELTGRIKTIYLDDLGHLDYPVSAVLNYDVMPPCGKVLPVQNSEYIQERSPLPAPAWPLLLLGAAFTPLREQFGGVPYRVRSRVTNVLITTGGTDAKNITGLILDTAMQVFTEPVCFHVITGALNLHKEWLRERAGEQEQSGNFFRIVLHEGVRDMAGLMAECDLAFSAAGTTLYELSAIGVPTICFAIAANQVPCGKGFAAAGAAVFEENFRFAPLLRGLAGDYSRRQQMSAAMRKLVDGRGTLRIVDAIAALC